jgi:lactate dehydrogenase-like 2-hydroxyacid dehydrogenase
MIASDMSVVNYDSVTLISVVEPLGVSFVGSGETWKLLDYISVRVSLLPATVYFINLATITKCKQGVTIINFADDGILDEAF